MTTAHSYWSASRFEQRMLCPGSAVLEQDQPDNANTYAAEGTAAHQVLTWAGRENMEAAAYLGTYLYLDAAGRVIEGGNPDTPGVVYEFQVDRDMAEHVQVCLDYVRDVASGNPVLYDVRLNYASYLGVAEDEAWGTGDVVILLPDEIVVVDFKYGMGVRVSSGERVIDATGELPRDVYRPNPQMACYGLGALNEYRDFGDFQRARLVISQPRITPKPSEFDLTIAELEDWGYTRAAAAVAKCQRAYGAFYSIDNRKHWDDSYLVPGEKQCKFCKAKATCPALRDEVAKTVFGAEPATPEEFAASQVIQTPQTDGIAHWLSASLLRVELIEDWCKGIRAAVEARLFNNEEVPEFKLVQGKKGNRAWKSAEMAEQALKSMRLKTEDMYDFKLISPTSAEKLMKAKVIGPRQWPKVQELITQKEGKPHVTHVSDPRPALMVALVSDDFTDVTHTAQDDCAWVR